MKKLLGLIIALGLVISCSMKIPASAQNTGPVSMPFALTAAGQRTPTVNLAGAMSSCSIVVTGGSSFTLVPQAASDGIGNPTPSWVTATTIGGGSITSTGTYSGQIATIALTSFGALLTTYTSGTISGTITCSGAVAIASGAPGPSGPPGPTGSPGPVGSGLTNLVCSGLAVCSPSNGPTPAINVSAPVSVANGGTGTASPNPVATATACGAAVARTGSFPSEVINVPVCQGAAPIYSSTAATSAASGTSANTYVQLPCGSGSSGCASGNVSFTTGVSTSPNGEWLVTITMPLNLPAAVSAENVYGCIASASTFTVLDATTDGANACATALTNRFAGDPVFGSQSVAQAGGQVTAAAHLIVANSTAFSMACYIAGSTTTSVTVYGYCSAKAEPY